MSLAERLEPDWAWAKVPMNELPFTAPEVMIALATAYLLIIGLGTQLMKGVKVLFFPLRCLTGQPFNLNWFTIPYNILMCLYSGWTFLATIDIFLRAWGETGYDLMAPICDPNQTITKGRT